jgi:pilus assembly protein Flp/PilA
MERMRHFAGRLSFDGLRRSEHGQGLVEYGLIIALIALVCIGGLTAIQVGLNNLMQTIVSML